jgi:hypothetical protein
MPLTKKWVCSTCPDHIYDGPTEDGFCPEEPLWHGRLVCMDAPEADGGIEIVLSLPAGRTSFTERENVRVIATASTKKGAIGKVDFLINGKKTGESASEPYSFTFSSLREGSYDLTAMAWDRKGATKISEALRISVRRDRVRELGLCVLLMDASSSMTEAVPGIEKKTKMQQVAESAARGIFDLERLHNNQDAWVTAFKFDDRVEKMFEESVGELIRRFDKDPDKFSAYIYDELFSMQQGTDINAALQKAHAYIDGFLLKRLDFPVKDYIPMYQPVLKGSSAASVSIPNIRVLMYTDGMQYDARGNRHLNQSPFIQNPLRGCNHDILIGAFFGRASDEGCAELRGLLSNCPIHDDTQQFFLFDTPKKIDHMKHLFRMASGASGFCPLCLGKALNR